MGPGRASIGLWISCINGRSGRQTPSARSSLGFHYQPRSAANLAKVVSGMTLAVVAGESSSLRAILSDLQACISEPARIFHYWTRSILGRLLNPGRGKEIVRETQEGGETVNATMKGTETGTPEKEYSGDCHHKEVDNNYGDGHHGISDDSAGSSIEDDDYDGWYHDTGDIYNSSDDHIDRELPPPSHRISYDGDSDNLRAAYCFSQDRVELFAVRPRFHFVGTLVATNGHSYYWASQEEENYHSVDFKNNLILHLEGDALTDTFRVKVKIIEDDGRIDHDAGSFSFTVDPYDCNNVMTRVISVRSNRKIELTFMAMHSAIQANVHVNLDFVSSNATRTGTIHYVYGEITAHHQLYNGRSVLLFSRGEENKAEVIDGELPLLRNCAVVPIYLEPLLILKFDLHVPINCDHDDGGCTIAFRHCVTFYPDQFEEKIICSANHAECHHGEVKVRITYQ